MYVATCMCSTTLQNKLHTFFDMIPPICSGFGFSGYPNPTFVFFASELKEVFLYICACAESRSHVIHTLLNLSSVALQQINLYQICSGTLQVLCSRVSYTSREVG